MASNGELLVARSGREDRLFSKDFTLVCLTSLAVSTSFCFLLPTLPLYVKSLGGHDYEIGLIIGVFAISALATRLFVGRALDLWGRKWLYVGGALAFLAATLLYGLTKTVPSFLLLRLFHGFGFATVTTTAGVLVADLAPDRRRGEAMGYYSMFGSIAMAVAPGIGLWLIGVPGFALQGFPLMFAVTSAVAAAALLLTLFVGQTRRQQIRPARTDRLKGRGAFFVIAAVPASLAMFFLASTHGAIVSFLPLYAAADNAQNVGYFFFAYSLVVLLSRPLAGRVSDRVGRRPVVIPSMLLSALGVSMLAFSPTLPVLLAAAFVYGLGFGALFPTMMALAIDAAGAEQRGSALATFLAAFDSGMSLGSMAFGLVAQAAGYGMVFALAGVCGVLGLVCFVLYPRLLGSGARKAVGAERG